MANRKYIRGLCLGMKCYDPETGEIGYVVRMYGDKVIGRTEDRRTFDAHHVPRRGGGRRRTPESEPSRFPRDVFVRIFGTLKWYRGQQLSRNKAVITDNDPVFAGCPVSNTEGQFVPLSKGVPGDA